MEDSSKITCDVVQDLMPLVCDGAGSKGSEEIVSEHISVCAECKKIWELLHRRDSALSPSKDDQAEKQSFRKSLKKQKRKFGIWKAVAILCALIVLCTGIYVLSNPTFLHNIAQKSVPLTMFQNAHLIHTKQGYIFLQFTPDEKFPSITGMDGALITDQNGEADDSNPEYVYRFSYNPLENKGYPIQNYAFMRRLPNGDFVFQLGYHYLQGKLMRFDNVHSTQWVKKYDDNDVLILKAMGAEACYLSEFDHVRLYLGDGKEMQLLYQNDQPIPLCDETIQEAIDTYFKNGWLRSDDLLSCLYAEDENDAALQEELKAMQEYQMKLFSSTAE